MNMTDDSPVSRRRVLRTVGVGTTVVLAGCSGGGDGSDNGDSDPGESTPEGGSGSTPTETQDQSNSQKPSQRKSKYNEPDEIPSEEKFEQNLVNEFGMETDEDYTFVEFGSNNVQLENKSKIPSGTPTANSEENPYPIFVREFRNFYARNVNTGDDIIFGYSLTVRDGTTNLIFKDFAQSESADPVSNTPEFGYSASGARSAIEKFFEENITGVKDVSENFPEELLKLAQS
jgi:hypothetical protein